MNVKRSLAKIERRLGGGRDKTMLVYWNGRDDARCKERVAWARRRGWRVRVFRQAACASVVGEEEARAVIAKHVAEGRGHIPMTVTRLVSGETLASWSPGLPAWLKAASETGA